MENLDQYIKDLERGEKDREADIKTFGEQFVNHYKLKTKNGVRYNLCDIKDVMDYYSKKFL
jgi:hypothetical protein